MVWKSCKRIKIQQRESHIKENRVLHLSTSFFVYFVSQVFCHCQMTQLAFIYFFNKSIYLFILAALGLRCCTWAFSSCGERGLLFLRCGARASHCGGFSCCGARALGTWASVVVACGLSSCGALAQLLHGMWDLPRPGIEPVSPMLAGRFLTTAPPGKSPNLLLRQSRTQ